MCVYVGVGVGVCVYVWCVCVCLIECDLETSKKEVAKSRFGPWRHRKKTYRPSNKQTILNISVLSLK